MSHFDSHPEYRRYREILGLLDNSVVGQRIAKQWLARVSSEHESGVKQAEGQPRVLLLIGPTGSGKTQLLRSLAQIINLPFCRIDASAFAPTGIVGTKVSEIPGHLARDAKSRNLKKRLFVGRGVVVIDEIDKIAFNPTRRRDNWHGELFEHVQSMLLPLFEGKRIVNEGISFDTSGMLIIAAGAFMQEDFRRAVANRMMLDPAESANIHDFVEHEDLVRFGFMPELVSRIRGIAAVGQLNESEIGVLFQRELARRKVLGFSLVIGEDAVPLMSRLISGKDMGARAASILIERVVVDAYEESYGLHIDPAARVITISIDYVRES